MKNVHPNLFNSISEEEWNENIEKLKGDVDKLSDKDVSLRIAQIVSSINDGHTYMNMASLITPLKEEYLTLDEIIFFPVVCEYFDDGLRIIECDAKYEEILGYKLLSINGVEIEEVIQKLYTISFYDNEQYAKETAKNIMNVYDFLEFLKIVDSDEVEYVFEDDNGNEVKLSIKAKTNKDINYVQSKYKKIETNEKPKGASDFYWMKYFEEDNILYFRYNACISDEQNNYFDFEKELVNYINSVNLNRLIIDLSGNGGGRTVYADSLVNELKNNTNLKGDDIVVISGKATFSTATLLTWKLQSILDATIIGEETGGNVNTFGVAGEQAPTITLPNSGLVITYPTFMMDNEKGNDGGVKPDIEIIQSYESYKKGIDDCYEYIKNM